MSEGTGKTSNVIQLFEEEQYYASCPECGNTEWLLPVNGRGFAWDRILGSICSNPECNCFVEWKVVASMGKEDICEEDFSI